MNYFVYFSDGGVPKTGLSPAWESLDDDSGAATSDNPTISEVGGGWYKFAIKYGDNNGPWKTTGDIHKKDLVGVIDGDASETAGLADADRYKPVCITLRGLALARLAHKASQTKSDGSITLYGTDGTTPELVLSMSEDAAHLLREPETAE